jgi:uncharacterized protein (TIGR02001 family)
MNNVLKTSLSIAIAATSLSISSQAFAGASANIGFTSDYVWRGWTQNDGDPAISGGLDYEMENGLYVGTWAANVANNGDDVEIDVYAGYANEVGDFGYDVGVIAYMYPGETNWDFTELYLNGSYKMIEAGIASTIAADDDAQEGNLYSYVSLSGDVGPFGVSGTVGNTSYDADGVDDVTHYQLAASYEIKENMGELVLALDDTDEDDSDIITSLSWTKSFDF